MDTSLETDLPSSSTEHLLACFIGLLILLFIAWHQRANRKQTDREGMEDITRGQHDNDFTTCQSPTCVRCRQSGKYALWRERLSIFIKKQTSDSRCKLQEMIESFQPSAEEMIRNNQNGDHAEYESKTQKPTTYFYPKLTAFPWYVASRIFDSAYQRDVNSLQDNYEVIKEDFKRVYSDYCAGNMTGWTENRVPSGSWTVFHLYNQGLRMENNCQRCPDTVRVLQELRTFMSGALFGYACFSVLKPGSHITPHHGPCNIRIRCHLGIQVPANCSLTVAGEAREWKERECLLFDDSFLHEATNLADGHKSDSGSRVIFMVDLWHPDLSDQEIAAFRHIFAPD